MTQLLLAFSRRQPLHPKPVDLSALLPGMRALLERTIGETIEVIWNLSPNLWFALADPGQIENALLNLGLNARDAMPEGGTLSISCSNEYLGPEHADRIEGIEAGDYVLLAVSDSGTGMAPETLEHAFEPFFTTKEVGQGSGLGLSMVYGFAKQSGGQVAIESQLGKGTTVKLYLPRAQGGEGEAKDSAAQEPEPGHGETVLVVEDDPDVCQLVETMISGLGYRVISAPTAVEARNALNDNQVDMVLSDVVLPGGVSGPAFAEEVRTANPELPFLFMSGYPAEVSGQMAPLRPGDVLLNKPCKKLNIAAALHAALTKAE